MPVPGWDVLNIRASRQLGGSVSAGQAVHRREAEAVMWRILFVNCAAMLQMLKQAHGGMNHVACC
jgi:hypothetical protein